MSCCRTFFAALLLLTHVTAGAAAQGRVPAAAGIAGAARTPPAAIAGGTPATSAAVEHAPAMQHMQLSQFFSSLDSNRDGEVDLAEAERFVGEVVQPTEEGWASAGDAAQHITLTLDGADQGMTVSEQEIEQHLQGLLQGHRVADWVVHGLNLPQYADAFRRNAITALDFPLLVNSGGTLLQSELGVTSLLHQQQLLRGMKRLILGLGEPPSQPRALTCSPTAADGTPSGSSSNSLVGVRLTWEAPATAGRPPFHKYVLQRQALAEHTGTSSGGSSSMGGVGAAALESSGSSGNGGGNSGRWEIVAEPDDEDNSWIDYPPPQAGSSSDGSSSSWRYSLVAWNAYGPSKPVISPACHPPSQPAGRQLHHHRSQASAAANAAALWLGARSSKLGVCTPGSAEAAAAAAAAAAAIDTAADMAKRGRHWTWPVLLTLFAAAATAMYLRGLVAARRSSREEECSSSSISCEPQDGLLQQEEAGDCASGREPAEPQGQQRQHSDKRQQELRHEPLDVGHLRSSTSGLSMEGPANVPNPDSAGASADTEAAAAAAAAEAEGGTEADEQDLFGWRNGEEMLQAIERGQHCAHPGCHRRFDRLRDLKRKAQSHFCRVCQHVVCLEHTRISPHGPLGGCGLDSGCICTCCFAELSPAQQAACERTNRLHATPTSENGQSGNGTAGAAGLSGRGSFRRGSSSSLFQQAAVDGNSGAEAAVHIGGGRSAAQRRWAKAGAVLRAVSLFKQAGSAAALPPKRQPSQN